MTTTTMMTGFLLEKHKLLLILFKLQLGYSRKRAGQGVTRPAYRGIRARARGGEKKQINSFF